MICQICESLLTKSKSLYPTNISFSKSNFYWLPRVHKSKEKLEAIPQQSNICIEVHEPYSTSHPKHCSRNIAFVIFNFISTVNQNNPKTLDLVKSDVHTLVEKHANRLRNIKLIHAKWQLPNQKTNLTNSLLTNETIGVRNCSDSK